MNWVFVAVTWMIYSLICQDQGCAEVKAKFKDGKNSCMATSHLDWDLEWESVGQKTSSPFVRSVWSLRCNWGTAADTSVCSFSLPKIDTEARQVNRSLTPIYTSQVGDLGVRNWSQVSPGVGWCCWFLLYICKWCCEQVIPAVAISQQLPTLPLAHQSFMHQHFSFMQTEWPEVISEINQSW